MELSLIRSLKSLNARSESENALNPLRHPASTYAVLGTGALCLAVALPALYYWVAGPAGLALNATQLVLLVGCIVAEWAALRYPVRVNVRGFIYFTDVPMYLLAVLLPVPIAALGALVGMGLGSRQLIRTRNWTQGRRALFAGRWTVFVFSGSVVAHIPAHGPWLRSLVLIGAAGTIFVEDILTFPITIPRMKGESMLRVAGDYVRTGAELEIPQYLVALLGAAGFASLPWTPALLVIPIVMLYLNGKRTRELQDTTTVLLTHLADAVDLRDAYTGGHSRRVTAHVQTILTALGSSGHDAAMVLNAARVHDIGKIGVPDSVLLKPGPLTPEERRVMEGHPDAGADLLRGHEDFRDGVEIVRHHHESWDGNGYPSGIAGYDIPVGCSHSRGGRQLRCTNQRQALSCRHERRSSHHRSPGRSR